MKRDGGRHAVSFHRAIFVMGLGIGVLSYAGAVMRRETRREQAVAA